MRCARISILSLLMGAASVASCGGYTTDLGSTSADAVVTGVVVDGDDLPVQGADVTLHQFRNATCDGSDPGALPGSFPPRSTDSAGRFAFHAGYPFSPSVEGCVMVWALSAAGGAASDSVTAPVNFRIARPYDSVFIELTLLP